VDDIPELDDGSFWHEMEAAFQDVVLPEAPTPKHRVEVELCVDEKCPYNEHRQRYFEAGYQITQIAYPILAAFGILRAHGDDIIADFLEAPFREMVDNYNEIGIAYGYWDKGDLIEDAEGRDVDGD